MTLLSIAVRGFIMRRQSVLLTLMLAGALPAAALAQETSDNREIVVTGRSLKDTADALAACLARNCPPDEDVAATLAHAENLFIGGDYDNARTTLLRSVNRNRKHGQAYPVPVSDLFRANSRIAQHMGEAKNFQLSVLDMRDTLKKGVGEDDPRTLVAQIEVGDSRAKLGHPEEAKRIYGDVEKQAIALNQPRVAMFARLRAALLKHTQAEELNQPQEKKEARAQLEDIIKNPLPGASEFSLAARVILARADRKAGRADTTADIVREFAATGGTTRPVLLFSEPIKRIDMTSNAGDGQAAGNMTSRLTALNTSDQWADVGFWVNPDGRVSDVEVLRGKGNRQWLKPVFEHLNERVYAPLKKDGNDGVPGFYMIERYTLTARFVSDTTGSRLRSREAEPRIERIDITPEDYSPPKDVATAGR
jgi:hypothetical protein